MIYSYTPCWFENNYFKIKIGLFIVKQSYSCKEVCCCSSTTDACHLRHQWSAQRWWYRLCCHPALSVTVTVSLWQNYTVTCWTAEETPAGRLPCWLWRVLAQGDASGDPSALGAVDNRVGDCSSATYPTLLLSTPPGGFVPSQETVSTACSYFYYPIKVKLFSLSPTLVSELKAVFEYSARIIM